MSIFFNGKKPKRQSELYVEKWRGISASKLIWACARIDMNFFESFEGAANPIFAKITGQTLMDMRESDRAGLLWGLTVMYFKKFAKNEKQNEILINLMKSTIDHIKIKEDSYPTPHDVQHRLYFLHQLLKDEKDEKSETGEKLFDVTRLSKLTTKLKPDDKRSYEEEIFHRIFIRLYPRLQHQRGYRFDNNVHSADLYFPNIGPKGLIIEIDGGYHGLERASPHAPPIQTPQTFLRNLYFKKQGIDYGDIDACQLVKLKGLAQEQWVADQLRPYLGEPKKQKAPKEVKPSVPKAANIFTLLEDEMPEDLPALPKSLGGFQ